MSHPCYPIVEVMPHQGKMLLLERILEWDAEQLRALAIIRPDMPMADEQGLPAWVGLELMAQAAAALAGCHARNRQAPAQIGFLVGSRRYQCNCSYFPVGAHLEIQVSQSMRGDNGLSVFDAAITGTGPQSAITASAAINIFQPADPEAFIKSASR
jgi:predicted hotdog family 3-hydroxylacyl-ACP dehydratase